MSEPLTVALRNGQTIMMFSTANIRKPIHSAKYWRKILIFFISALRYTISSIFTFTNFLTH